MENVCDFADRFATCPFEDPSSIIIYHGMVVGVCLKSPSDECPFYKEMFAEANEKEECPSDR